MNEAFELEDFLLLLDHNRRLTNFYYQQYPKIILLKEVENKLEGLLVTLLTNYKVDSSLKHKFINDYDFVNFNNNPQLNNNTKITLVKGTSKSNLLGPIDWSKKGNSKFPVVFYDENRVSIFNEAMISILDYYSLPIFRQLKGPPEEIEDLLELPPGEIERDSQGFPSVETEEKKLKLSPDQDQLKVENPRVGIKTYPAFQRSTGGFRGIPPAFGTPYSPLSNYRLRQDCQ